jgi:hypothetical protein
MPSDLFRPEMVTMLPPVFCTNICLTVSWVRYRKPSRFVEISA